MTEDKKPFARLLQNKRIGLVACGPMDAAVTGALQLAQASFAHVDATLVSPGDKELERYHALILRIGDAAGESNWLRPEMLRNNSCPLLLAGESASIYYRISLQNHADDVIFVPFFPSELIFRLSRLISGVGDDRHAAFRSARPCVLVADDDRDIVVYLKSVLQNFDVDAHFVSNGRAALAAARRLLPDLVLLDVGMPLMNGIDVLRALRNDPGTSALVVALLTASADTSDVRNGAELGAVHYILKPFGHLDLIRKLKPLLRIPDIAAIGNPAIAAPPIERIDRSLYFS